MYHLYLIKYVHYDEFTKQCHKLYQARNVSDGLVEGFRMLLASFDENGQNLTQLFLRETYLIFSVSRRPIQQIFCLQKRKCSSPSFFTNLYHKSASRSSERLKINYVWPHLPSVVTVAFSVLVLPLGKLGGRLGRMTKRGCKNDQKGVRNLPKITKEGCKTYQN